MEMYEIQEKSILSMCTVLQLIQYKTEMLPANGFLAVQVILFLLLFRQVKLSICLYHQAIMTLHRTTP